jgi:hypothetical protein
MCKKSRSGIRIQDEQPGSYFRALKKLTYFLSKMLKFFDVDLGSGMEKIWIRDPG